MKNLCKKLLFIALSALMVVAPLTVYAQDSSAHEDEIARLIREILELEEAQRQAAMEEAETLDEEDIIQSLIDQILELEAINGSHPAVTADATVGVATVSTWDELRVAMGDATVSVINLGGNITRTGNANNHLPNLNRSLTINGNGHTLDFAGNSVQAIRLARRNAATELNINNLNVANSAAPHFIVSTETNATCNINSGTNTDNWNVTFNNVASVGPIVAGMFRAQNSVVTLRGNIDWNSTSNRNSNGSGSTMGVIVARDITAASGSNVNLTGRHTIFNLRPSSNALGARLTVQGGATVNAISTAGSKATAVRLHATQMSVNVESGGHLYVRNFGHGKRKDNYNAAIMFRKSGSATRAHINVAEGARLELYANFGPAVRVHSKQMHVNVGTGATFIAHGNTAGAARGTFDGSLTEMHFNLNSPEFYDFANFRQGRVIRACSRSRFNHTQATVSVWRKADNVNRDPRHTFNNEVFDFRLNNTNMKRINHSTNPAFNNSAASMTKNVLCTHSRISGRGAVSNVAITEWRVTMNFEAMTHVDFLIAVLTYMQNGFDTNTAITNVVAPRFSYAFYTRFAGEGEEMWVREHNYRQFMPTMEIVMSHGINFQQAPGVFPVNVEMVRVNDYLDNIPNSSGLVCLCRGHRFVDFTVSPMQ